MREELKRAPKQGEVVPLGPIALVAHRLTDGRASTIGLRLAQEDTEPMTFAAKLKKAVRYLWSALG
jgi:hypothetical protein